MNRDEFVSKLKTHAQKLGIDKIAFADLTIPGLLLRSENAGFLLNNGYHIAVSIAMRISEATCSLALQSDDEGLMNYFKAHALARANQLDDAALKLALYLENFGYKAFVVPGLGSGYTVGAPGIVSHMAIANVSGLGTMGDSGMILTPEFGPRVRLSTIITDCPLPVHNQTKDICIHCGLCKEACPSGAITGKRFDPHNPSGEYMDRATCAKYRDQRLEKTGNRFCNICMAICPIGAKQHKTGNVDL
ncbi:MAG: 4Fe-4S binding protein [Christensenellales bacterium]|jgi:epoxyqueuosine reductase